MGNAWTQRRANFPRPQVCKPPIPPVPPVLNFACFFDPTFTDGIEFNTENSNLHADDDFVPGEEILTVTKISGSAFFTVPATVQNQNFTAVTYDAFEGLGTFVLVVRITDSLGNHCDATWTVEVNPFP